MLVLAALGFPGCSGDVRPSSDDTPPEAALTARPPCGPAPLTVSLDASESRDPESGILGYAWDFDGDGGRDTLTDGPTISYTYADVGTLFAEVRVTNGDSLSATAAREIWILDIDDDPSICAYPHRRTESVRDIEYTLGLSRPVYAGGDTIRFYYRIANGRPGTVEFPLHWTCLADFYVFEGTCSVLNAAECSRTWRYNDHEICVLEPSRLAVAPGESEYFTAAWHPQFSLSAGRYTAFALLNHGPANPNDSTVVWVGFEIE